MAAKSKKSLHPMTLPAAAPPPAPPAPPPPALSYEALAAFGREAIAAAVQSNAALSAGIEAMGQELMLCARDTLQSASETARGLLGAKTLDDVIRLQTALAHRSFATLVAGSLKLSELGAALAAETCAPWEGRVEATMARFLPASGKSAAA